MINSTKQNRIYDQQFSSRKGRGLFQVSMLKWLLIVTLMIPVSASSEQGLNVDTASFDEVQSEWVQGLLLGKDMSPYSASYAENKGPKAEAGLHTRNPLINYQIAEQTFLKELNKLTHIEGELTQAQQGFIDDKHARLKRSHDKLIEWVNGLKRIQFEVPNSKKPDQFLQLKAAFDQRIDVISQMLKHPVETWNPLTRQMLKSLSSNERTSTAGQSASTSNQSQIILRNDRLPYNSRNFLAPELILSPEIIPAYANDSAAAGDANDLVSDDVVALTPEIYELAESLEHDYIRIYNFVRQQVTEQYYSGSMKGSQGTLLSYAGNDVDQAALLMALLRASNIPARFVHGVIQQPVDEVMNGLGLSHASQVLTALDRAGIAYEPVIQGGQISAIQKQYTWVSAYVPYAHYRGSANDLNDPAWIPLAPAIKQTSFDAHEIVYGSLPIDENQLVHDYLMATNSSSEPMTYWKELLNSLLLDEPSYDGYESLLSEVELVTPTIQLLPASLPFTVIATTAESPSLLAAHIHHLKISLNNGSELLNIEVPLPKLAGNRVTLSYLPATVDDLNIINQAGGMSQVPPYLVELRPVIKINGRQVETVTESLPMAELHDLNLELISPNGVVTLERKILAGTYLSFVLTTQNDDYPLNTESTNLISDETLPIRLIHNLGVNYHRAWNQVENELASVMDHAVIRPIPALSILSPEFKLETQANVPLQMQFFGVSLDAISRSVDVVSRSNQGPETNQENEAAWMRLAALQGSWLESKVFDSQWAINAISADKGLRINALAGDTIHHLNAGNIAAVLPTINHPDYVKSHIQNWIGSGHQALIAENLTSDGHWLGSAWHIWHPDSGNSGYFLSGGYAGGQSTEDPNDWEFDELASLLSSPYAEGSNYDPMSGRNVTLVEGTNFQYGVVNEMLPLASQVLVTDAQNRPVVGAFVRFAVKNLQARLESESGLAAYVDTYTDESGVAEVDVKLAERIYSGPLVRVDPADENLTQLGLVEISALVNTNLGFIEMGEMFNHYAIHDQPDRIGVNECNWNEEVVCNRFGSQQEMRGGNIHVVVLDQYDNAVPNVPIYITAEAPVPQAGSQISNLTNANQEPIQSYQVHDYQPQAHEVLTSGEMGTINTSSYLSLEEILDKGLQTGQIKSEITGRCDVETPAKIAVNSCYNTSEINVPACATDSATIESQNGWSTFTIYNGKGYPATRFPIKISATGLDDQFINRYNGFEFVPGNFGPTGVIFFGTDTNGPNGNFFGDKPDDSINKIIKPFYLSYSSDGTPGGCNFIQYTIESIENSTTESVYGNASLNVSGSLIDWDVEYQLGSDASENHNRINNENVIFGGVGLYPGTRYSNWNMLLYSKTVTANIVGRTPETFILNSDSLTSTSTEVDIEFSPATYRPLDLTAVFYEEDEEIYTYTITTPTTSTVKAVLPAGIEIDVEKNYYLEVVMNKDSVYEIVYDKQPLEGFSRKLVSAVNCEDGSSLSGPCGGTVINGQFEAPISLSTAIDFTNDNVCRRRGFDVYLNTDSRVTIEAFKHDVTGVPTSETMTIISDELMVAGNNSVDAVAEDFGNHRYSIKITAVAEDNGDEEEVYGTLVSRYDLSNSLPIGHAIVKGVDLADGSMVYSKKDIALESPGPNLEFVRTYTSQGRHDFGPMGYGWAYNYMSRVIVGDCGIVTVTGADGGSARFKIENEEFIPLKGYHSSLVLNDDGSFDFFPKGGNRYHYVKQQPNSWWMEYIEDPNGNRLSVELLQRNDSPIIRSVTDAVGRRLVFNYQIRDYGLIRKEMLVSVNGPAGINLTFEYDDIGNLISAEREGDTTNEVMGYSGEVSGPSRSLLLSVSDQATSATRTWTYQEQNIEMPPAAGDIPDINSIEVINIAESDSGSTGFSYTPGLGYNTAATVTTNGQVSNYTMNFYGAATEISSPAGIKSFNWETETDVLLLSETDENNRLRSFEYDDFGNVITERLGSLISTYTYYSPTNFDPPYIKNRVKTMTNWRGFTTSYGYDLAGNKISEELDQVTQITDYDSMGLVKTFTDGRGLVSTFTYDTNGYPKSARNPAGDTQYTEYSARGQKLTEKDGNGYTTVYSYDTSDRVKSKTLNSRVWLYSYQNGGRTRIETNPNGHDTTYTYDTQGRLLTTTNAATDTMTYVYDNNGNKTSMTDFGGHATTYSYDDANRLTVKTELMGKVTTYDYDNVGNVLKETTADRVTDYTYDPNRYFQTSITRKSATGDAAIVRTVDGMGNVLTETDPNQHQTIFTYDAFDRVLTANGPMGSGFIRSYDNNGNVKSEEILNSTGNQVTTHIYDTANRLKTSHLAEGGIITYSYDGVGNIIGETRPNGYDASYEYNEINLPIRKTINSQTWSYSYDNAGNLKTENWPSIDDVGNVITYDYDELNREISRSDTVGQISLSGYDADSNLTSSTDANGHLSTFEYNDLHQRIVELKPLGRGHTYSYTVFGELLTDTGPNGTITHTVDQLGRRTSSSGPDQYNMIYGYDANGNLTSQIDSRSITTTYGVNALNQVESVTTGSFIMGMTYDTVGNQLTETDYRGIASVFTYDKENRRETFTKAGLLQSTTTYNLAGLPVIESDARGKNTIHEYNSQYHKTRTLLPESQIIAFTPNTFGDVTFQNNPGPNDITRTYDLRRRLKTETNGANETTTYEYDLNNNRTAVIKPGGQRWEYDFDAANRLTHVRNVPESIETIYSYDAADNLRTITDAKQRVTTFTYDNRNRKRSKIYPGGGSTVTYTYDGNNNLKTVDYPNGVNVTYAYDDLNRQTNQSHTGAYGAADITFTLDGNGNVELVNETVLGTSYQTTMTYDDLNRQKSKTDRYGNSFLYTYDANGNRKLFRDHENKVTEYFYDGLNRIEQLTRAGLGTFDWSYNTSGLPRRIEYPNGSEASYSYDSANRIALIENKQSGVIVTSHDYEYDLNGNRDRLTESNIDTSQVTTYEYDDADRLTKVLYPTTINSYTLDKVGNRELELIDDGGVLTTRTYGYNSRDQLTSVTDTDGLNITYDYDEFGNQIEKIDAGIVTTFDYTPRQRVKNITIGAGLPIEYQYDYAGQRVNSQANGMEKRHLYDGLTLIADTNAIGNTLATYHYGVRRQLAETRNGQNAYYLADALGTNVAITNQDGSIQNRMDYDVWGNLNQESATSDSPFGFTGYIKDDDTELYYANARYYDSFTGRFLREDPFEGNQNMPPTLHRYLYANGNPTVYIDPTGKVSKFNEWIEFLNEPVQIMNDEIANEDTSSLGVIGLTLSSLPNEAASGGVSILNTFANALIVDAENKLKSIHPYANLSNIIGEDTRQIRNEHEAFKNSVSNLGEVIAEENIDLIRQGFEKFGTTLGHMAAGDNNALSSITNGVAGVLTGSYLTKTKFKGPDLDAKLEVGDAYKDKPIMIGESNSNSLSIDLPIENFNRTSINLSLIKESDLERMTRGIFEPQDFNLRSIRSNDRQHLLWTQAMRDKASSPFNNKYKEYLNAIDNGSIGELDGSSLSKAYAAVRDRYKDLMLADGNIIESDIHHWNFSKGAFPLEIVDPRNLFHTNSKIQHNSVHLNVGPGNGFDFNGPVEPFNQLNIDTSFYPLPEKYFSID